MQNDKGHEKKSALYNYIPWGAV